MLIFTESDVESNVSISEAIAAVDAVLVGWSSAGVANFARVRVGNETAGMNILPAIVATGTDEGFMGLKSYSGGHKGGGHLVTLYSIADGQAVAVIEARYLGALRTGAISAVATRAMHGPARSVACIGAGAQAEMQIRALAASNQLEDVAIFSRTEQHSRELAERLGDELGCVSVAASAAEAVAQADVVCTITRAASPVVSRDQLRSGTHINAAGSNSLLRREIGVDILQDADVVVDSREQARLECGDLLPLVQSGALGWADLTELGELLSGAKTFTATKPLTVFESLGMGLLDIALASTLVKKLSR